MERSPQPDSFELSDYAAVLRRRWWIVVLAGFLGLAAAAAYTVLTPATYTSSATVYVRAMSTDASQASSKNTSGVDLDTEAQFVQSASVATLAKQKTNSSQSVTSLLGRVSVTVPANSQVLQISCTGRKATAAAQCAHAFAAAYLQNRSATANDLIQAQLSAMQQRENTLQQKITTVTLKIKPLARGSSERITLNTELSSLDNQMNLLSGHAASLVAQSANLTGGRIITDAVVPRRPSNPRPSLYLPSGLAAGLLIGLVIAFWRDRSDKRVRSARDVETAANLPVLLDLSRGKAPPAARSRPIRDHGPVKRSPNSGIPSWPPSGRATMSCSSRARRPAMAAAWLPQIWRPPWPERARRRFSSAPTCAAASRRLCSGSARVPASPRSSSTVPPS